MSCVASLDVCSVTFSSVTEELKTEKINSTEGKEYLIYELNGNSPLNDSHFKNKRVSTSPVKIKHKLR